METRPYRPEDWAAVCQIYDLSKPDELHGVVGPDCIPPLDADDQMQALFHESQVTVVEDMDEVVGFGGSRTSSITWLFVHPKARRRGVASMLVRHMLTCRRTPVFLNVVASNFPARKLYEAMGFMVEREFQGSFNGNPCNVARLRHEAAA